MPRRTPIYRNYLFTMMGQIVISRVIALPFIWGPIDNLTIERAPIGHTDVGKSWACLMVIGLYVSFISAFPIAFLVADEEALGVCHPIMRPAFVGMVLSIRFFAGAGYLFASGMFLFFKEAVRYWMNLHVT